LGAIVLLQVRGTQIKEAVDTLKDQFPEIVWVAGAWGDVSMIAFLEAPRFEDIASLPFALGNLVYVGNTKTCIIPSTYYHVKEEKPSKDDRLAVTLLNLVENAAHYAPSVMLSLGRIPEVKRYGAVFGQWDAFAEVRYKDEDALQSIVMEGIHAIPDVLNTTST
jgi:hypothetical protein